MRLYKLNVWTIKSEVTASQKHETGYTWSWSHCPSERLTCRRSSARAPTRWDVPKKPKRSGIRRYGASLTYILFDGKVRQLGKWDTIGPSTKEHCPSITWTGQDDSIVRTTSASSDLSAHKAAQSLRQVKDLRLVYALWIWNHAIT